MRAITINQNILGGVPCFTGTRVPVYVMYDHLKDGYTLDEFLADFPTVPKPLAEAVLELAKEDLGSHAQVVGTLETAAG